MVKVAVGQMTSTSNKLHNFDVSIFYLSLLCLPSLQVYLVLTPCCLFDRMSAVLSDNRQ